MRAPEMVAEKEWYAISINPCTGSLIYWNAEGWNYPEIVPRFEPVTKEEAVKYMNWVMDSKFGGEDNWATKIVTGEELDRLLVQKEIQ